MTLSLTLKARRSSPPFFGKNAGYLACIVVFRLAFIAFCVLQLLFSFWTLRAMRSDREATDVPEGMAWLTAEKKKWRLGKSDAKVNPIACVGNDHPRSRSQVSTGLNETKRVFTCQGKYFEVKWVSLLAMEIILQTNHLYQVSLNSMNRGHLFLHSAWMILEACGMTLIFLAVQNQLRKRRLALLLVIFCDLFYATILPCLSLLEMVHLFYEKPTMALNPFFTTQVFAAAQLFVVSTWMKLMWRISPLIVAHGALHILHDAVKEKKLSEAFHETKQSHLMAIAPSEKPFLSCIDIDDTSFATKEDFIPHLSTQQPTIHASVDSPVVDDLDVDVDVDVDVAFSPRVKALVGTIGCFCIAWSIAWFAIVVDAPRLAFCLHPCASQVYPLLSKGCHCLLPDYRCAYQHHHKHNQYYDYVDDPAQPTLNTNQTWVHEWTDRKLHAFLNSFESASVISIRIADCPIRDVPSSLLNFPQLSTLHLFRNDLQDFTLPIQSMKTLFALRIHGHRFETIPLALKKVPPQLRQMVLNGGKLRSLGSELGLYWKNLVALDLSANELSSFPSFILNLHQLQNLNLAGNDLPMIPSTLMVQHLPALKQLHLDGNQLQAFPDALQGLKHLNMLTLASNEIQNVSSYEGMQRFADKLAVFSMGNNQVCQSVAGKAELPLFRRIDCRPNCAPSCSFSEHEYFSTGCRLQCIHTNCTTYDWSMCRNSFIAT